MRTELGECCSEIFDVWSKAHRVRESESAGVDGGQGKIWNCGYCGELDIGSLSFTEWKTDEWLIIISP